jgi:hypothetical protein
MAGRRTNLALLVALGAALLTGGLAYGIGSGWNRWAVVFHAIAGFAVLALSPWKSTIIRRGLRRTRAGRAESIGLGLAVVVSLVAGVLHASGLAVNLGPLTAMQVHVGAALIAVPLAVVHLIRRPQQPRRADLSRRTLMRGGALLGAGGLAYLAVESALRVTSLAGADRRFTGSHERGSFDPEAMPVTQWLDDDVPEIDADQWSLELAGESVTYADLARPDSTVTATLDCTGGWYATQEWGGNWLSDLLGPRPERSVVVTSATGYTRAFPMRDVSRLMLATAVGGRPLSAGHGFPVRLVAPERRGFWWVKWVVRVEPSNRPWWLQLPFPPT